MDEQIKEEIKEELGIDFEDDKYINRLHKKAKKKVKKRRLHEIKKVLMGNLVLNEDNSFSPGGDFRVTLWGSADGAFGTMLLGIAEKTIEYELHSINEAKAFYGAAEAMKQMGRAVVLESVTEGCSCLIRHIFFRPTVLVFEKAKDGTLVLRVYCGRDVLTYSSIRRAVKMFDELKPRGLEAVEEKDEESSEDGSSHPENIKEVMTGTVKGFIERVRKEE